MFETCVVPLLLLLILILRFRVIPRSKTMAVGPRFKSGAPSGRKKFNLLKNIEARKGFGKIPWGVSFRGSQIIDLSARPT